VGVVSVSHFMSIMKKKKKRVCGLYFVPLYAVILRAFAEEFVDLGQIYNLRTSWDDTCAQAAPSLAKHTRQFLFLDHITSLTSVNR
jgi:predicted Zn-dependent peptidase